MVDGVNGCCRHGWDGCFVHIMIDETVSNGTLVDDLEE